MVSSGWSCMRYTANWSAPMSASSRSRSRCAGTGPVRQNLSTMASGTNSVSGFPRSEEHTSELQSPCNLVCRLLPEKIQQLQPLQECSGSFSLSGIKVQSTQMEENVRLETLFVPIAKGLFDQPLDFIV